MDILYVFLFILAVSLVAGAMLLIFSYLFAVKKDPLETAIRECLPGINCGACGYKGCDDYASALSKKGEKPNLGVRGTQKAAEIISDMLGIERVQVKDMVAYVACNGHCGATFPKSLYDGVHTCKAAMMLYGGPNSCSCGCLGFGDCAAACPSHAICTDDGIARVNTSLCVGCGICAQTCPGNIIKMLPQEAAAAVMCGNKQKGAEARKVCKNACIACKKCEKACPNNAIRVIDNLAVIDYEICSYCGHCISECPTGCLKTVFFPDLPENCDFRDLVE